MIQISMWTATMWVLGSFGLGVLSGYSYGYVRLYNRLLDYLKTLK